MTSYIKKSRSLRRSVRNVTGMSRNARQSGELAVAAARVVSRRTGLAAEALATPLTADYVEFGRMAPEKVQAFTSAGMILIAENLRTAPTFARLVAQEWMSAGHAVVALATAGDAISLARVQSGLAWGWLERALNHSSRAYAAMLQAQAAALVPVRRAALKNARRLTP